METDPKTWTRPELVELDAKSTDIAAFLGPGADGGTSSISQSS
ncbi:hypothetical protein [Aurantiacibacter luteus]|nr:hypothetical protein [Aurantiacibacter luteus]